jgi:RNA polymerase sigma-70 factor, ECF subfamily
MRGSMQETSTPGIPQTAEHLFEEYAGWVCQLARRLVGNDADADDVTQDVFLQVVRNLSRFRGEATLPTWLYRVTVNAAVTYRRKRAARREQSVPEVWDGILEDGSGQVVVQRRLAGPEKGVVDQETQRPIERAITRLPETYQRVYVLADVTDIPNTQIARMLGLSVAAVKSRLHRARLLMRKVLAPYHEEYAA